MLLLQVNLGMWCSPQAALASIEASFCILHCRVLFIVRSLSTCIEVRFRRIVQTTAFRKNWAAGCKKCWYPLEMVLTSKYTWRSLPLIIVFVLQLSLQTWCSPQETLSRIEARALGLCFSHVTQPRVLPLTLSGCPPQTSNFKTDIHQALNLGTLRGCW